jgi:chemotaxis signal transduction protein
MKQKNHILVCTLCDFNLGFDIAEVDQIAQMKQVQIFEQDGLADFRGYTVPFLNLPQLFHCNDSQTSFILLLNSPSGRFCVPIRSIEGIIDVEQEAGLGTAESLKHLTVFDYANRIILWNDFPVPVIVTEKISKHIDSGNEKSS